MRTSSQYQRVVSTQECGMLTKCDDKIVASHRASKENTMAEMRLLVQYFAQFDGKKSWDEVLPFAESLYHPEMVVWTGKGSLSREVFKDHVKTFVTKGGAVEMLKVEKIEGGIRYEIMFHNPDGSTNHSRTMGTFKDGKLIQVQPDEPSVYTEVLQGERTH